MINELNWTLPRGLEDDVGSQEHLEEEKEETQHVLRAVGLLEMCSLGRDASIQQGCLSWSDRDELKRVVTHPLTKNKPTLLLAMCSLQFKEVSTQCGST